ncbi:MAG: phosphoglycerate kinase [Rickettsiales bacterium]
MIRKITQTDLNNKKVFLRVDLNVPVSEGVILDETRINKIIPTIEYLINANAKIILASHFGRPKSSDDQQYSLNFLQKILSKKLNQEVLFCSEAVGEKAENMANGLNSKQVMLLENLRFYPGETKNDFEFATSLSKLADVYVNDAFSCSHRAHASISELAEILPSFAGLLLEDEIDNLSNHLNSSNKPMMAIIGGSKVSSKLDLLNNLMDKVDYLVIGGAMANTFLKAKGIEIGKSFYEEDLLEAAKKILKYQNKCKIILPHDVVVAKAIASNISNSIVSLDNISCEQMILDIGPLTCSTINQLLQECKTVVCNGPLGVFEHFPFCVGTISVAQAIAKLTKEKKLISVAGGGDIVAALSSAGLFEQFSYISTAGGAFLEWLEGKALPGIKVLSHSN